MKKIDAVIPIRFTDCCLEDGTPKYSLQGKPLWDWTIEQVVQTNNLNNIVVAYDDKRFEQYLEKWNDKIVKYLRPDFLSKEDVSLFDVTDYVLTHINEVKNPPDYALILEITHPLRPKGIIQQLVDIAIQSPADSIFTVYPVHYNFWREELGPMKRFQGSGDNSQIKMFRELTGICSVFKFELLKSNNPFGEEIDMIPIDRFWATIDVRDEDGLWLAEQYLNRIQSTTLR
jgi:CMP-N-acetylneuraminic acid synthetase